MVPPSQKQVTWLPFITPVPWRTAKFDSSIDRGSPFQCNIGVGQVIKGWDVGIPKLSVGEKARLTIPGPYAYGPRGFPGLIPPNSTLVFDVELLKVN
ncbi:peptidylprolyl isomerase [Saccharomyces cerevisiae]|nr:peptidylprolyl isomerase [Saccharomyces cerevisiae]